MEEAPRARLWLRAPLTDVIVSFTGLTAFTAIFLLLGATLLVPLKLVPHDAEVLTVQANFLTQVHSDLLPLYVICVLMVFFGTVYGGLEISTRAVHELGAAIWPRWRRLRLQTVRLLIVGYALTGGLMVVWTDINPLVVVTPAAIFGGVFSCGLWCFAMLSADVYVPLALRMRFALRALLVAAGTIMTLLGVVAMYDYGRSFR